MKRRSFLKGLMLAPAVAVVGCKAITVPNLMDADQGRGNLIPTKKIDGNLMVGMWSDKLVEALVADTLRLLP